MTIYFSIIKKDKDRRILFQILTGEGKSSTIACLAAILYMKGHTVDIITTSKMLAKRDAEEKKDCYGLMGIGVSHNLPS
jgi:preprotein translocase subunit SecA